MTEKYTPHPIANIFPMIAEDSFQKLKADIEANGIKEFGLLYEGKILDGRNRYRAARELGIEMTFCEIEMGEPEEIEAFDPVSYVLSQNLHRRHLKQSQRAMIAAKMATLKHGQRKTGELSNDNSLDDVATLLSVSKPTVCRAKHVIDHGSKELIAAVEAEAISVSLAEKLCKAVSDKREQAKLVKEGKKVVADRVKEWADARPPAKELPNRARKSVPEVLVAFRKSQSKANDLRVLVEELDPSFRQLLKEWLQ